MSVGHTTAAATVGRSAALADGVPSALADGAAILATANVTHRAI